MSWVTQYSKMEIATNRSGKVQQVHYRHVQEMWSKFDTYFTHGKQERWTIDKNTERRDVENCLGKKRLAIGKKREKRFPTNSTRHWQLAKKTRCK